MWKEQITPALKEVFVDDIDGLVNQVFTEIEIKELGKGLTEADLFRAYGKRLCKDTQDVDKKIDDIRRYADDIIAKFG